jgi:hypothetical protein
LRSAPACEEHRGRHPSRGGYAGNRTGWRAALSSAPPQYACCMLK